MIKFYRGLQEKYFLNDAYQSTYADALYFATDKGVLYLNGKDYGSEFPYKDVELVGNELILTFRDPSLGTDGKKVINLIEQLQKATSTQDGLMSKEYAALLDELGRMKDADEFGKVDGIVEGDKILSVSEKLISATLDLHYGEESGVKYIYLLGNPSEAEDAVEGRSVVAKLDAAPFIADGMLEDAEFTTNDEGIKGIEFTWNVVGEDGQYKTDFVPLTDLIVEYSAGNGISVENNVVSVKLDESKTRNLLSVSVNGLSLESVPTDATVLQQDIVVAGISGTLGTGSYKNGTTIPAGTSIYTILQNILCKEQYPSGAKVERSASLTSAYAKPSFTLTSSSSTVEVGTQVTVSAITGYDPTPTTKSRTYTGFSDGYSLDYGENQIIVTGNPPSVSVTNVELTTGTYSVKREYTKFGSPAAETATSTVSAASCTLDSSVLSVKEGDNTVKVTISGPGHKGEAAASPIYYKVSNLKNTKSDEKVAAVSKQTWDITSADSSSNSLTVTGRYKYYYGYPDAVPATKDQITSSLKNNGFLTSNTLSVTTAGTVPVGKYMVVAVPQGYAYTSFVNGLNLDDVSAFYTATNEVDYALADGTVVKYSVHWHGPFGADTNYNSFTLQK